MAATTPIIPNVFKTSAKVNPVFFFISDYIIADIICQFYKDCLLFFFVLNLSYGYEKLIHEAVYNLCIEAIPF